ncbi:B3 domain-containing transcription repressor VAL1 [Ziziphus jujuba]|uniref:B3 domain-containing transcription repressor VAL1 n=1 Tax=Ziziphus jujuba TaxID=326968 RepID=A0A6P3Z9I9_ZIZJJ|nr:B3 domain-containing transcription repressor VAL1 [Ziziphus jujuba]
MGSKICMNESCGATNTHEWKNGWPLKSGGFASLCHSCGSAYENSVYCDSFHQEQTGWRDCSTCGKHIHCGCIASKSLYEFLDIGGVGCTSCASSSQHSSLRNDETPKGFGGSQISNGGDSQSTSIQNGVVHGGVDEGRLMQLCKIMEANESNLLPLPQRCETNVSLAQTKRDDVIHQMGEIGPGFSGVTQSSIGSLTFAKPDNGRTMLEVKDMHESCAQPSLNMTLGPSGSSNFILPFSGGVVDLREHSKQPSSFQQGQRSRPIFPKPLKSGLTGGSETNKSAITQMRIARPPGEGRGKNQLLPRYWPRITDQELEKLSGDLNSTIVPLFEKVLSASDAGRIGRLVLPKACAEAYFPHISQSEGLPLRIQDVKGNEWTFQFRFWPNNNSRMYVLEGVTPCIQTMQLRAGDTVTFSRIDPGGKLVMGFRKASNSVDMQDAETSVLPNGTPGETFLSSVLENMPGGSGQSGHFQTNKGSKDPRLIALSENLHLADEDIGLHKCDSNGDSLQQSLSNSEKKRTRNIGSKSKRLLMHSEDVLELRLTWEEAQDLLRPPPSVKPSIVTIEDHEFEEYDEPPVFGKRTIFISRPAGGQEQWAQCDDCSKWRGLPVEVLLPPKWTCSDNCWDSSRSLCSVPEEMSLKELENLVRANRDFKKRKTVESHKAAQDREPSGLDALASAAVLGDNVGDPGESSVGATTRHPRHRPGCTCIVCIQPPSGKGKHKPTCTCNVCMTVKRRFKTLMLRKKKRQSEREAEMAQKDDNLHRDELEINGTSRDELLHMHHSENEGSQSKIQNEVGETSTGQIDLNCHPNREDMQLEGPGFTMMNIIQVASLPLENYMKQNGIANLMCKQQGSIGSCLLTQDTGEGGRHVPDEGGHASVVWERENDQSYHEPNLE